MPTKQTEPAPAKIIQLVTAEPVRGGDNTIDHDGGRVPIAAWGLQDDGKVVALVRSGNNLVAAADAPQREPAPEPVGLTETPTEPAPEAPADEAPDSTDGAEG